VLAEVGRANAITVSQEEVNRGLLEEARRYPGQERQVIEYYRNNPGLLDGIRAPLYEDKVVDFIVERAQVTERSVAPAELLAAAAEEEEEATETAAPAPDAQAEDHSDAIPSP
jgi:trigger factor